MALDVTVDELRQDADNVQNLVGIAPMVARLRACADRIENLESFARLVISNGENQTLVAMAQAVLGGEPV